MVADDRENNLDRESVRVELQRGLTHDLGVPWSQKKSGPATENAANRKAHAVAIDRAPLISMALRSLINMVGVTAVSGTVLIGLLIVKRF